MCKTQNEQKIKPKPDEYAKQLAGTVLFTSSVARAKLFNTATNKNSTTLCYTSLYFKFCYVWQHCLQATTRSVARSGLA
jgi:hypothetical protein